MTYDEYEKHMAEKYPRYCGELARFGGYAIGEGWYPIIEQLIAEIDHYTKWKRSSRARDILRYRAAKKGREALIRWMTGNREMSSPSDWLIQRCDEILEQGVENLTITPKVNHITIDQIKEKFGVCVSITLAAMNRFKVWFVWLNYGQVTPARNVVTKELADKVAGFVLYAILMKLSIKNVTRK